MARKLKTFTTSIGFYDLAIAAPSMKAALEAWGTQQNLFHQGLAEETDDADVVAATLAKPGVVLRRAVGTQNPFQENAPPPKSLAGNAPRRNAKPIKKHAKPAVDSKAQKAAVIQFEKEKAKRDHAREQQRAAREMEDAEQARQEDRRQKAEARAQAILDRARERHEGRMAQLEKDRQAAEDKLAAERERWRRELDALDDAVRDARG